MACPMLRRAHGARCRGVAAPTALPVRADVVRARCQSSYWLCPAYRFLLAAGRPVHPADFEAWVVRGISPGRTDPDPVNPPHPS